MYQQETIAHTLTGDVSAGGNFTVAYPNGRGPADYAGGTAHVLRSISKNPLYAEYGQFSIAFGASTMTVTIRAAHAFLSGEVVWLDLDVVPEHGSRSGEKNLAPAKIRTMTPVRIALGAPAAADADGVVASQAATAADGLATGINGALATDGVATFDVPRNVVAAWTGTAVITVTGTDEYGNVVVESSASGTSLTGKKAFKTVTGIAVSANVTGLTVGSGVVLGLPVFLGSLVDVLAEIEDDADATPGTIVAGVTTTATATTGDVRGTVTTDTTPDGSAVFEILALVRDPNNRGVPQFAG
jgi:hypothetical protein